MPEESPQGLFHFPGVRKSVSGTYTLSHGITPGVAVLELSPQLEDLVTKVGELRFTFGAETVKLRDCRVDRQSFRRDSRGNVWSFAVQDRRWRWSYGEISGHYNLRRPDGSIDPTTEKNSRQLAALCLEAMGEGNVDLGDMPDGAYPEVHWEAANPAQALAAIAELLGCRVVLRLDDTVAVVVTGKSNLLTLPFDARVMETADAKIHPNRPDSLKVVCGRTRYQADLTLEAVGEDLDGTIVPIDQLSYTPVNSWEPEDPKVFDGVPVGRPRDLALATVYRWYQVVEQNPGGVKWLWVPGYPAIGEVGATVKHRRQILPVEDVLVETETVEGVVKEKPAQVFGTFWTGGTEYANTPENTLCKWDYVIDRDRGIVQFRERITTIIQVGANPASYRFVKANLMLRCAVSVRDEQTLAWDRFTRKMELPPPHFQTGPRILPHEEIVLNVWPVYDADNKPKRLRHNRKDVIEECRYYLNQAEAEYKVNNPKDRLYAGLIPINPDGAVQQVTWSVGPSGATTRASWNDEHAVAVPSYAERRAWEKLRGGEGME